MATDCINASKAAMDSRIAAIMLNLDLNVNSNISKKYMESKEGIQESEKGYKKKVYKTLTSTFKETYITGSLKYGNNYIM